MRKFRLLKDCRVYIHFLSYHATYPPTGFVAISPQLPKSRFRFPLAPYLLNLLNELKLAPFQLTPNLYAQLISLAILFLSNQLSPPSPRLINFFFFNSVKDRLYYLTACPSQYKVIRKENGKSNVGDYKSS